MKYALLFSFLLLSACAVQTDIRQQTADHIARPAFMSERFINANGFQLKAWERMHQQGGEATIYIEGDSQVLGMTTPSNPVALHLASRDKAENLAYLARPCQFIKMPEKKGCHGEYMLNKLYTEEVIEAYETALDNIVQTYNLTGLHLVGYDGGANIAAVLTARNDNILSLRTVAGNLNPALVYKVSGGYQLDKNSVYATDYGTRLATVPQYHFIGGVDDYITPSVYHSYRQTLGLSECVNFKLIPDASHKRGWVEKWPALLELTPYCKETYKEVLLPEPTPVDIPVTRYKDLTK